MLADLAAEAMARCRKLTPWYEPPINPFSIARHLGVEIVEHPLTACEAMIVRAGGRVSIAIDPSLFASPQNRFRLRFTIAHELAHLILDEVVASMPRGRVYVEHSQREKLCDCVASNLLLPREALIYYLDEFQGGSYSWRKDRWIDAHTVVNLSRRFQVSVPALATALREFSPSTLVLKLINSIRARKADGLASSKWRVAWSSPSSPQGGAVFREQSLDSGSALGRAATKHVTFLGPSFLKWSPLEKKVYTVSGAPSGISPGMRKPYVVTVRIE